MTQKWYNSNGGRNPDRSLVILRRMKPATLYLRRVVE